MASLSKAYSLNLYLMGIVFVDFGLMATIFNVFEVFGNPESKLYKFWLKCGLKFRNITIFCNLFV